MKHSGRKPEFDGADPGRRRSFAQFFGNLLVAMEEVKGHPHCAYRSLEDLPKEQFLKLVPKSSPDFRFKPSGNWLVGRDRRTGKKLRLMELHTGNTTTFNMMNGSNTVERIVAGLSTAMNWEEDRCYAHVRTQILFLVGTGAFTFATPVDY